MLDQVKTYAAIGNAMAKPLHMMSATDAIAAYKTGEVSPVDYVDANITQAQGPATELNALLLPRYEAAMAEAEASAARWRDGSPMGPLDGLPMTIKESIATAGDPAELGAVALAGAPIPQKDAPSSQRVKQAGAIIIAKTTMPDFGLAGSGASTKHGPCLNPYDQSLNTSGSSAGSAAALAVGAGALSIGTDLCGSVRNPAAWCGVVGLKASYGRVAHRPVWGTHAGPLARCVADARSLLDVIGRHHPDDPSSLPDVPLTNPVASIKGARIGVITNAKGMPTVAADVAAPVENVLRACATAGADIIDLTADPIWGTGMELWSSHLQIHGLAGFSALSDQQRALAPREMMDAFEVGAPETTLEASRIMAGMVEARVQIAAAMAEVDVIISPTLSSSPFAATAYAPQEGLINHLWYTGLFNMTGTPAISIPCGFDAVGTPVGLQIAAPMHQDRFLMAFAEQVETMIGFEGLA